MPPDTRESRPAGDRAAIRSDGEKLSNRVIPATDNRRQNTLKLDMEHFRARVLQDALIEATAGYWRRRAHDLVKALSQPGDYLGQATPEQAAARDRRIRDDIARCCLHAQLIEQGGDISDDVRNVFAEVA